MINQSKHVALIPARKGSKRLPGKNIKLLNGVPLISYTIMSAIKSERFTEIIVSTNCQETADIALSWGAKVPCLRPEEYSSDQSTDIEWVNHAINQMITIRREEIGYFSILRPTSPLRSSDSISKAITMLDDNPWADSIRAMELTNRHPGKMWRVSIDGRATPFLIQSENEIPTYNRPTQSLPKVWVQNASLEVVRYSSLKDTQSISGENVLAINLPGYEGYDINTQEDWDFLEYLITSKPEVLQNLR
jgi:CMP-N,N'-diacetyllegionaminic acid synthase